MDRCRKTVLAIAAVPLAAAVLFPPVKVTTIRYSRDAGANVVTRRTEPRRLFMFLPAAARASGRAATPDLDSLESRTMLRRGGTIVRREVAIDIPFHALQVLVVIVLAAADVRFFCGRRRRRRG